MCCVPFPLPLFTWVIMSGVPHSPYGEFPFLYSIICIHTHRHTHKHSCVCTQNLLQDTAVRYVPSFFVSVAPYSGTLSSPIPVDSIPCRLTVCGDKSDAKSTSLSR